MKKVLSRYSDIDALFDGVGEKVEPKPDPLETWEGKPLVAEPEAKQPLDALPYPPGVVFHSEPEWKEEPLAVIPGELFNRAMMDLREYFADKTNPSAKEWTGLYQIILAIQGMADHDPLLPAKCYLSALPCGGGKTSAVVCTLRQMIGLEKYKHTSAIIFVFKCDEIPRLVEDMGLDKKDFAVMVSESGEYAELNELGNQDKQSSRILFTTQARLQKEGQNVKKFSEIKSFLYEGNARDVLIWDEAITPSRALIVRPNKLARLFDAADKVDPEIGQLLKHYFTCMNSQPTDEHGLLIDPIIQERFELDEFVSLAGTDQDDRDCAEALWRLSGNAAKFKSDGTGGTTALHYADVLPEGFAPLLILDASGLQRDTYRQWAKGRGGLQLLLSPEKDYTPFRIRHQDRGTSAVGNWRQVKKTAVAIANDVSEYVSQLPKGDKKLIVVKKPNKHDKINREALIKEGIPDLTNISFTTWGKHTATNEWNEYPHIILAGVIQYKPSDIAAMARGAQGMPPYGDLSEEDYTRNRIGEFKHNVNQAACRGKVRKSESGRCPTGCSLFIVFSTHKKHGIPQQVLSDLFPGADIQEWQSRAQREHKHKSKGATSEDNLIEILKREKGDLTTTQLQKIAGIKSKSNLKRTVHSEGFQARLKEIPRTLEPGDPKTSTPGMFRDLR